MAFFIDAAWAGHPKRGSYTLTIEETGEQAAQEHTIKAPIEGIITKKRLGLSGKPHTSSEDTIRNY